MLIFHFLLAWSESRMKFPSVNYNGVALELRTDLADGREPKKLHVCDGSENITHWESFCPRQVSTMLTKRKWGSWRPRPTAAACSPWRTLSRSGRCRRIWSARCAPAWRINSARWSAEKKVRLPRPALPRLFLPRPALPRPYMLLRR